MIRAVPFMLLLVNLVALWSRFEPGVPFALFGLPGELGPRPGYISHVHAWEQFGSAVLSLAQVAQSSRL